MVVKLPINIKLNSACNFSQYLPNTMIFPGQKQLLRNFWKIMATLKSHTCKVLYLDLPLFNPEAESKEKHGVWDPMS